jgi:hypothetical protein
MTTRNLICFCRRVVQAFLLILALCSPAFAGVVALTVVDASGAPLKDVLVIFQDLRIRDADEMYRALTDERGRVPSRELKSGQYRVICTTPYGLWKTDIREVAIGTGPIEIKAVLSPLGTHGYGDVVIVPETHFAVRVKHKDGKPCDGAAVLVRDSDATLATRHWYRTKDGGKADVMASGTDIVMVVFFGEQVVTRVLTEADISSSQGVTITLS